MEKYDISELMKVLFILKNPYYDFNGAIKKGPPYSKKCGKVMRICVLSIFYFLIRVLPFSEDGLKSPVKHKLFCKSQKVETRAEQRAEQATRRYPRPC